MSKKVNPRRTGIRAVMDRSGTNKSAPFKKYIEYREDEKGGATAPPTIKHRDIL